MLVGEKLTLLGVGLIPLEAEVGDVFINDKATGAMGVVPFDIDTSVQITFPVFRDVIVLFEGILKVISMAVADSFKIKVINDEAEEDRAPFVEPEDGSGGALVVAMLG